MFLYSIPGVRIAQTKLNQLTSYVPPPPSSEDDDRCLTPTPKRILIVHSHPVPKSLSAAIADTFEQSAVEAGHNVKRISLYDDADPTKCYPPNMSRKEREHFFDSPETKVLGPEVKTHVDLLKRCDALVLIYPTWWMNTPASLKGFFDRTLVLGHTWDFPAPDRNAASLGLVPKLTNLKQIVGISTYGASQLTVTLAGDNGRRMISNAIRHSVAPAAAVMWLGLYGCDMLAPEQIERFLQKVKQLSKEL
jgi:NAD(P)H dehydrogenase (quinone)